MVLAGSEVRLMVSIHVTVLSMPKAEVNAVSESAIPTRI
jgi:hypothetical protein